MIKILLLIDYSSEFDRKLLRGLVQYSKENGPWLFYRLPSYYSGMYGEKGILKWAKEWKADAIIGQWNNDTVNLLKELNIPIVLQNYHHRSTTYSNLTGDYKGWQNGRPILRQADVPQLCLFRHKRSCLV